MPTTATYSGYVVLDTFDDTTGQWTGAKFPTTTTIYLGDDSSDTNPVDGSAGDGTEADDELLTVYRPSNGWYATGKYTGWTYNGDPIVLANGTYYIYTNTSPSSIPSSGSATSTPTYTYCFARGTRIVTPAGECAVESLNIGDIVVTAEGKHAPVKWIGRQTRHPLFAKLNAQLPVLIKSGALGEGLPTRDLYVSPDHAMLVDGVLVHALALVNGVSIVQMQDWHGENVEYFHIELENHDLVLAEGAPAETFVDNASRKNFDNYEEYVALFGEGSQVPELSLPRVKNRRQLSTQTKRRLMGIALDAVRAVA